MTHVILGLLMISRMSLYDLVKSFESGVAHFYSASSGSIKRALDALLAQGTVEVASVETGGRGRKLYRVTPAGRREFGRWMTDAPAGPDPETAALSRLFFFGLIDPDERITVLRSIIARAEAELATLTEVGATIDVDRVQDEFRTVSHYQRATLDYGVATAEHALAQFRALLAREQELRDPTE